MLAIRHNVECRWQWVWKKCSEETQTLHAGCSKAEPKKIAPPQTPFPGTQDAQNLISWRWSLTLPTNRVWWGSMHAISSYSGNSPTLPHTHTHRQDRLQYTAPQLARSVNINLFARGQQLYNTNTAVARYCSRVRQLFLNKMDTIINAAQNTTTSSAKHDIFAPPPVWKDDLEMWGPWTNENVTRTI